MAEQPVPFVPATADVVPLRLLIAPRDAARVALGRLHVRPTPVEPALRGFLGLGASFRTALLLFAVGHRSSIVEGQLIPAYHVITD
jgi:hypothetical protein